MKSVVLSVLALGAVGFLSACASLTKEECQVADWQVIGQRDAELGHDPQARFKQHISACKRAKISPDQTLWYAGFQRGLTNYCTPRKGLSAGQAGKTYNNICPVHSESEFLRGYSLGTKEHQIRSRISSIESSVNSLDADIDQLLNDGPGKTGDKAKLIRSEINNKRLKQDILRREKEGLVFEHSRIISAIEQFQLNP